MAMSDGLPGSASCSDKEDPVDHDEEHLRHHVQNWLDAAVAVSGGGTFLLCMSSSEGHGDINVVVQLIHMGLSKCKLHNMVTLMQLFWQVSTPWGPINT